MPIFKQKQTTEVINIALASEKESMRSYEIRIGSKLLECAGELIEPFLKRKRVIIIADQSANANWGVTLRKSLRAKKIEAFFIIVRSGEETKSFASFERVCEEVLEIGIERSDLLVAFGGGVVGDLTGFVAGVINRGIDFIQIPTTLLSQVDSSVGGKTAINAKAGKNLIGLFWQPRLVIADTEVLVTLDSRDVLAGFAEIFKIGLLHDKEFFEFCKSNYQNIIKKNGPERLYAIKTAINAKAKIVEQDEREAGIRALLNLGHTFGHAIEAAVNYDETKWRHGEAVATGIAMAARFSARSGFITKDDTKIITDFIRNCGYNEYLPHSDAFEPEKMLENMRHDKKNQAGKINLILLRAIGEAFVAKSIDENQILDFLKEECAPQRAL